MEQNDVLSNKLLKKINRIEKTEASIKKQKDEALTSIRKELPRKTFLEMAKKISDNAYGEDQLLVEEISKKEAERQKLEYDDYVAILKMYNGIAPTMIKKDVD